MNNLKRKTSLQASRLICSQQSKLHMQAQIESQTKYKLEKNHKHKQMWKLEY
jgi:hypothetical protein